MAPLPRYFLLIWVSLGITLCILDAQFSVLDQALLLLSGHWWPVGRFPGLGVLLTVLVIFVIGIISVKLIGQRLLADWEGTPHRIPVIKFICGSVRQVSDTLSGICLTFRRVLRVHNPHPNARSIAI